MLALTHLPSPNMQSCERTFVPHAAIDYDLALRQHATYCQALRDCGALVRILNVNTHQPDCTFIEDTTVILDEVAILCSLGAPSRRAEVADIAPILAEYREVVPIDLPATLEGGDVLRLGRTLLVGRSPRTSAAGIAALTAIGQRYGYSVRPITVHGCLHFKTASTALPDGCLLINPAWVNPADLHDYDLIPVPTDEPWAANTLLIGSKVLLAAQHRRTADLIHGKGFDIHPVDLSEFAKAEGGPTCLSLLFD